MCDTGNYFLLQTPRPLFKLNWKFGILHNVVGFVQNTQACPLYMQINHEFSRVYYKNKTRCEMIPANFPSESRQTDRKLTGPDIQIYALYTRRETQKAFQKVNTFILHWRNNVGVVFVGKNGVLFKTVSRTAWKARRWKDSSFFWMFPGLF